ncbi:hypothetical protein [Stakelama saccharophila]|uniref:Succinate dehydrogenase cytochrome b subunit family protein n=1 Tax=Stakelama saccharophila TaxID=3075605 RepID=A0ABZ0BBF5_9SPHN|nr:hypothetical protein [Stakelama sp. W311]WNO54385.1 hypothetical protein RPR59_03770 [Stakelama sp. W311]
MAIRFHRAREHALHPLHAVLLGGAFSLFLGTALSDLAYNASYFIQWTNFGSWMNAGGLVFAGLALIWAIVDLIRFRGATVPYFLVLLAAWVLGFIGSLVHARDAWGAMPAALILSILTTLLVIAGIVIGLIGLRMGERA